MRFLFSSRPRETITVLMPCKTQRREFFVAAVESMLGQRCGQWELLILTDPESPAEIGAWAAGFGDERVKVAPCPRRGFAQALNHGLAIAKTAFVSILLSDDRYAPRAIGTLLKYRSRFPEADFFHSARRHIDSRGQPLGPAMPSRASFTLEHFPTLGCPVKHLLCWRRETALAIGGMREELSAHGCDDYDFPWRMAERGAKFRAVSECLYEYRLHGMHDRLTTTVPVTAQMETLRIMFENHGVDARQTDRYLQQACQGYLIPEASGQVERHRGSLLYVRHFREAGADTQPSFVEVGHHPKKWFPHRVYVLPKGGPDGWKLAKRMFGATDPGRLREFVLYGLPAVTAKFPRQLFYRDDLQWHQQQFGLDGQVACGSVIVEDGALRCYTLVSDLVQRAAIVPQHRTQLDRWFDGWNRMLVNAIVNYAAESDFPTVYFAGSRLALKHTDPARQPKAALFERVYDDVPRQLGAAREGEWWRLDVNAMRTRIVPLSRGYSMDASPKTVCITHDIERGLGHVGPDPAFARRAEVESSNALRRMLEIESRAGVRATYAVVGQLLSEVRALIERGGHAVAFHSWDHRIPATAEAAIEQLLACRRLDYRLKGYRVPQSKITRGLQLADFVERNFEWIASSASSLGTRIPVASDGIIKIPVHADDYPLFLRSVPYAEWQRQMLAMVENEDFVVIGLHDCYGHLWLEHYEEFLRELKKRATLITLDEVAARVTLGHSRWFETGPDFKRAYNAS